ncbi:hypothetical protein LVJ94_32625 [Pendulispora rubella]|uniref:DUF4352 domain-containing protein n=1 Tax=Pendulispora rubella TaxID=2741070 RepID=A0ABZ2KXF1_9BACT
MRSVLIGCIGLGLGGAIGYFVGRSSLAREWERAYASITPAQYDRSARDQADPTPAVGEKVLGAMPLTRTRLSVRGLSEAAPVVVTVGSIGSDDDEGRMLHLTIENRGACTVSSVAGVAYGFDAWGRPSEMNRAGEHYVSFEGDRNIAPGAKAVVTVPLRYARSASLAAAHVDRFTCIDGAGWAREKG